jgi:hypothetical protein
MSEVMSDECVKEPYNDGKNDYRCTVHRGYVVVQYITRADVKNVTDEDGADEQETQQMNTVEVTEAGRKPKRLHRWGQTRKGGKEKGAVL